SRSRLCACRVVPSRPTTATDRCISRLRSAARSLRTGRRGSPRMASKSKGAPNGRAAAKASISAIPTGISWSWQRRDYGQFTNIQAWNRCSSARGGLHNRAVVAILRLQIPPGLEPGEGARMARPRPKVIRLTDAAAERIKYVMANAAKPVVGVRVGVKNGGCAGMTYTMEYADAVAPADEVVEDKG